MTDVVPGVEQEGAPPADDDEAPATAERAEFDGAVPPGGDDAPPAAPAPAVAVTPSRRRARLAGEALAVGMAALVLVYVALGLWRARLREPFSQDGDAAYYLMLARMLGEEGTYLHTAHLGWPFGMNLYDVPQGSDNAHLLVLRALMWLTGSPAVAVNLFFVLSFAAVAAVAYAVLRAVGVRRALSAALGLVYAFVPYHFARGTGHLFLSGYELVPLAVLLALCLFRPDVPFFHGGERLAGGGGERAWRPWRRARSWWFVAAAVALASTGAYYAVFTVLLVATAGVSASLARRRWRPVLAAMVLVGTVAVAFAVNESPSIAYQLRHGRNAEADTRTPSETEIYGLRISQLFAPRDDHRISALARLAADSQSGPVPSEGGQQLGLVGALGLALLLVVLVVKVTATSLGSSRSRATGPPAVAADPADPDAVDGDDALVPALEPPPGAPSEEPDEGSRLLLGERLGQLGVLAVVGLLVGTVSGFSYLLSAIGLREIRAWNRISIVIAFLALVAVALVLDEAVRRWGRGPGRQRALAAAIAVVVLAVALYDQTPSHHPDWTAIHAEAASDEAFFATVAGSVGPGGKVLQLPDVRFPEAPAVNGTGPYEPALGYVFQPELFWSYGSTRGRAPDLVGQLAALPPGDLVREARTTGFDAVVVDRRGYTDGAAALEAGLTGVVGPAVTSTDGRYALFVLTAGS